jgi:hypothetical protein
MVSLVTNVGALQQRRQTPKFISFHPLIFLPHEVERVTSIVMEFAPHLGQFVTSSAI